MPHRELWAVAPSGVCRLEPSHSSVDTCANAREGRQPTQGGGVDVVVPSHRRGLETRHGAKYPALIGELRQVHARVWPSSEGSGIRN